MSLSRKCLAEYNDADFSNCVNTGYRWKLWADGHISAESHSRWSGSRTGERFVTEPEYACIHIDMGYDEIIQEIANSDREKLDRFDELYDNDYRKTCNGYVVR